MLERIGLFLNNELTRSDGGVWLDVRSPMTQELVGRTTLATTQDVNAAVAAARQAFDNGPWPRLSPAERRAIVLRAGEILAARADELSALVTAENGVIIRYQQGDMRETFAYFAGLPYPEPELRPVPHLAMDALIVHEAVGVVAAIVPWNAPVLLGSSKFIPALLAGCTVVLKPAPETPLHDFVIAEAFAEAGLPPGVFNVVVADRDVSETLVRHPDVDMVSFTGSTAAGRRIGSICGEQIKRSVLELGGKSAAIILDDINAQELAGMVLHTGMLLNNGEACMAWTRLLVPRSRHDELVDAFCDVLAQVRVGDPMDPATDLGPLVAERQRDRVERYIRNGMDEGAKVAFGGGRPKGLEPGWFVEPTLFVNADNSMKICREEIFGPVGTVIAYDDVDDAVRIANDTNYGLAGGVFTGDLDRGREVATRIRAGTVAVNCLGCAHAAPFGGYKDSGIGRAFGPEGFSEYFEVKSLAMPGATSS